MREACARRSHHVEQDAKHGFVGVDMRVLCPILRSKAPALLVVACAAVLGINEQDVNAYFWAIDRELSSHLKQHTYAACAVVGTHHRFGVVGFIGVVVGPWTAVPVCHEKQALRVLRIERGNHVGYGQFFVGSGGGYIAFLNYYSVAAFGEKRREVGQALGVSFGSGNTRPEAALSLDVGIGAVGIEIGSRESGGRVGSGVLGGGRL